MTTPPPTPPRRVLPSYVACPVPYNDDAARRGILADLRRLSYPARLETLDALPMPSLNDYNDTMHPYSDGASH